MSEPTIITDGRKCFDQPFRIFNGSCSTDSNVYTSNHFIHEIVLEMCNNPTMQKAVLSKLKYFAGFSTDYLSDIHLKQDRFQTIIQHLNQYISESLNKEFVGDTIKMSCYRNIFIVNFIFNNEDDMVDILANPVYFIHVEHNVYVTIAEHLNNNDYILCRSIVGKDTLDKYGIDGFLALLIIYIDTNHLLNQPKSLKTLCEIMKVKQLHQIYHNSRTGTPRECLKTWLNGLKFLSNFDFDFGNSICEIDSNIQQVLFKCVRTYGTDIWYVPDLTKLKLDSIDQSLHKYINDFITIKSKEEWIKLLENVLKLSDDQLLIIGNHMDRTINNVLLNFCYDNSFPAIMKISIRETYVVINGNRYPDCHLYYNSNGTCNSVTSWTYNHALEVINVSIANLKECEFE